MTMFDGSDPRVDTAARRLLGKIAATGVDRAIVAAMADVPRHEFVGDAMSGKAYEDIALPIGLGQTISQPTLVAQMTDTLRVHRRCRVLEVGTGCGYQTAILAELAGDVFTIELEPVLAADARIRLRRLGYRNITARVGNGAAGWPEHAPFDAVIVTASAQTMPVALVDQLAPGGRMVIPVQEDLVAITKDAAGNVEEKVLGKVAFVPLR